MIQRVFLDTNVILDLMIQREPFLKHAEQIFLMMDVYDYEIYASALSVANIAYSIDRLKKKPHDHIGKLLPLLKIVDLTGAIIHEVVSSKFDDFEDGLQHYSAVAANADVIVTRNEKDFKHSVIPTASPQEFLTFFNA